jgi:hypothetical protein
MNLPVLLCCKGRTKFSFLALLPCTECLEAIFALVFLIALTVNDSLARSDHLVHARRVRQPEGTHRSVRLHRLDSDPACHPRSLLPGLLRNLGVELNASLYHDNHHTGAITN